MSTDYETYKLGDWKLKNGGTIPDAHIAYKTFGKSENPAIIYPSWYSGLISDNEWLIGMWNALLFRPRLSQLHNALCTISGNVNSLKSGLYRLDLLV